MKTLASLLSFVFVFMLVAHPAFAGGPFDPAMWQSVADKIGAVESGVLATILGFALELGLRWTKTNKPVDIIRSAVVLIVGVAKVLERLAQLLDKVLKQRAVNPDATIALEDKK
jgi:hypothetical protein